MSTIAKAFDHGKALIPFITCGDPSMEKTAEYVRAVVDAGADLVELGIPFSDPTAEGDVIMAADARALAAGTTTEKVFDLVRELRRDITVPMVLRFRGLYQDQQGHRDRWFHPSRHSL